MDRNRNRLSCTAREDHGAIGTAAITKLPASIEGIHIAPVGPQQGGIADLGEIKTHPHRFLMPCATRAHLAVGGVGQGAAAVAAHRVQHPGQMLQVVLQAPEAAAGQHRLLHGRLGRNMQVVSVYTFAFANYFGKQPIRSIDDIKGKKFRVNATAAERAKMRQLGGTAVPMDLSEVIPGLQQGVIDGTQSATAVYVNLKFNEINKSLTESNDTMVVSVGVISRAFLNRLPPDLRQLVIDEGAKVQARMMSRSRQLDEEARKRWSDAGGEWLRFSAADQGRMRTLLSGIGEEVTKDNAQVNAFYKRMLSTSQKF